MKTFIYYSSLFFYTRSFQFSIFHIYIYIYYIEFKFIFYFIYFFIFSHLYFLSVGIIMLNTPLTSWTFSYTNMRPCPASYQRHTQTYQNKRPNFCVDQKIKALGFMPLSLLPHNHLNTTQPNHTLASLPTASTVPLPSIQFLNFTHKNGSPFYNGTATKSPFWLNPHLQSTCDVT